jgi:hypothetical protein
MGGRSSRRNRHEPALTFGALRLRGGRRPTLRKGNRGEQPPCARAALGARASPFSAPALPSVPSWRWWACSADEGARILGRRSAASASQRSRTARRARDAPQTRSRAQQRQQHGAACAGFRHGR